MCFHTSLTFKVSLSFPINLSKVAYFHYSAKKSNLSQGHKCEEKRGKRKNKYICLTSNVGYRFLSVWLLIGPCGMIGDCLFPVVNPGQCRPQWPRSGAEFLTPMIHWRSQAAKKKRENVKCIRKYKNKKVKRIKNKPQAVRK